MLEEGARLLERAGRAAPERPAAARCSTAATALRDDVPAGRRPGSPPRSAPEVDATLRRHPLRELVTASRPAAAAGSTASGRCTAPGTSSSRAPRARSSDGERRCVTARFATAPERLPAVAGDGLRRRLPAADPPDRHASTARARNNTLDPGPGRRRRRRGRSARAEGGHDAIHPDLGTIEDFDALRRRGPRELGLEVALDFALQASPDHPWVDRAPRVVHHRADGTIAYAENPPKKYQDIYPINFDNDPEGIYAEVLRVVRHLDRPRRADLPGRQPAHQAGELLGVADRARSRKTDPDVIFLAEAFTRPAMMHDAGPDRLPPVLHVLHLAQRARGSSRSTSPSCRSETAALPAAELLRQHPRHPARLPAVRRPAGVQDPRRAGRDAVARPGASTPATSCTSTSPLRPGSEEYLDSEKYQLRPRDWDAAERRGPHARAVPHPAQRDPPRAPGAAAAAQPALPPRPTTTRSSLTPRPSRRRRRRRRPRRRQPRPARRPARTTVRWTCRHSAWTGTTPIAVHDELTGDDLRLGQDELRAARPVRRAGARLHACATGRAAEEVGSDRRRRRSRSTHRQPAIDNFADAARRGSATRTGTSAPSSTRCWSASFHDSNGDGIGDLAGLIDKLDYLQWLGVDCLWLPPFFTSPLRDGGYDVADYTDVLPEFGTIGDFVEFVDAAHQRGMRVIIDFVMNHTSRPAPVVPGVAAPTPTGPYGDFYVWADDDRRYPDARIIFVDTETSNWTFDPVRKQYFWHRFFTHQPDLNFENPARAGGDASRRCGSGWTSASTASGSTPCPTCSRRRAPTARTCPRTHEFLKRVRKEVDAQYPDRVLLVRGQPVAGRRRRVLRRHRDGDECHMAFHFPVMPRMFMARAAGVALPDLGDPGADAGDPGQLPVGHLPAQPRRADPRDGHRRGARLHVGASTPRTRG